MGLTNNCFEVPHENWHKYHEKFYKDIGSKQLNIVILKYKMKICILI